MTFYRPGGTSKAPNRQYDYVYVDFAGAGAQTDWLPVNKGDSIAVNICRASIVFSSPAQSVVTKTPVAPECQVLLEMAMFGGETKAEAWPIDQWQNMVVATDRRAHRAGWVRLRCLNINNGDGTGIAMALQISRTGETGAIS